MNDQKMRIVMSLAKAVASTKSALKMLHKHWHKTAVITGALQPKLMKKVPKEKLKPGELSAVKFKVGCYKVRSSVRIYQVSDPGYDPDSELPATAEDVEQVRRDTKDGDLLWVGFQPWRDRLRITQEISAKHSSWDKDEFTYVCRATEARNLSWSESIGSICAAKENMFATDDKASLFVCSTYMGSSFASDTWYKLSPSGKLEILHLHPYDEDMDEAKFKPVKKD